MSRSAERVDESAASLRDALDAWIAFLVCVGLFAAALYPALVLAATQVVSTRVWPAKEYTRVTLESATPVRFSLFSVGSPPRVVLDLDGVEPGPLLDALTSKVSSDDPYIRAIRYGRFKPGVLRVVFDLKNEIRTEAFTLAPVGAYGHRLVVDFYPLQPVDPLMALVHEIERTRTTAPPPVSTSIAPPPVVADSQSETPPRSPGERSAPAPLPRPPGSNGSSPRFIVVAVDAGHGGEDPGAIGPLGTYEKDVTLGIARRLKTLIDAEPGMRAVLTRDGDFFVPLHTRVQKARRVQADLLVSVHADAFIKPQARGSSIYALSERGATSAAAQWLAKRENDADLIGGINLDVRDPHLKQTLLDLTQTATINDSLKLGRAVLGEIGEINALHKAHVEQAGFAVLKAPDIPSVLVETAFITNPDEERKLRDEGYQNRMAAAIVAGIKRYLAANPPLARAPRVAQSSR